jgi:hypothetical protein
MPNDTTASDAERNNLGMLKQMQALMEHAYQNTDFQKLEALFMPETVSELREIVPALAQLQMRLAKLATQEAARWEGISDEQAGQIYGAVHIWIAHTLEEYIREAQMSEQAEWPDEINDERGAQL